MCGASYGNSLRRICDSLGFVVDENSLLVWRVNNKSGDDGIGIIDSGSCFRGVNGRGDWDTGCDGCGGLPAVPSATVTGRYDVMVALLSVQ